MKRPDVPQRFDVASIKYKNGCMGIAFAPVHRIDVGDHVVTAFDNGTVMSVVDYCTPEDDWYKLLCDVFTVDKITHKIVEVVGE